MKANVNSINKLELMIKIFEDNNFQAPENLVIKSNKILKQLSRAFNTLHGKDVELLKAKYKGVWIEKE